MKLFLYSLGFSVEQSLALAQLVGKPPNEISMALIENAADVDRDGPVGWVEDIRKTVTEKGFQTEVVDLRHWLNDRSGLREKLAGKDVIWVAGGNTYYLRWILKATGADEMISELARNGTVYAGWSAGAGVVGPTLKYLDTMDDVNDAPEVILDGLHLTDIVVVPHIDNAYFAVPIKAWGERLRQEGYTTVELNDSQALVINGDDRKVI